MNSAQEQMNTLYERTKDLIVISADLYVGQHLFIVSENGGSVSYSGHITVEELNDNSFDYYDHPAKQHDDLRYKELDAYVNDRSIYAYDAKDLFRVMDQEYQFYSQLTGKYEEMISKFLTDNGVTNLYVKDHLKDDNT